MTDIWTAALDDLQRKVSAHNYESWFQKIDFRSIEEDVAHLEVGDDFQKAWIEDNYLDLIEDSLEEATGAPMSARLHVSGGLDAPEREAELEPQSFDAPEEKVAARIGRLDAGPGAEAPAPTQVQPELSAPRESPAEFRQRVIDAGMNPRYIFDEYVVGPSNQFVHAACSAVAQNPASAYNPLFIFGGVGLGKTHLLQAVGIEVLRDNPDARVVNLSSEDFMNQLITSLRNKEMNSFRTQFRNRCDLLLIDDIQFIAGKDSTQEEFFHTFNALYHSGKQIVITSDQLPKDLPGVEERLRSRFSWGLCADIQPPEMETRIAILEKKAESDGIELDKDVAILLASSIRSNVRELEGTLIRLGAQASLMNQPITMDLAKHMLDTMNIEQGREVDTDTIIDVTARHFDISSSDIRGRRRTRAISEPRQYAMYLARKHTDHSYPQLGEQFGGKDHTTVLAAFKKMSELLEIGDTETTDILDTLEEKLFH
ncbi:MAG: chromosomal replication initiator protein DnaA [Myxococcota bacterium]